jgi:hypothetical protein
MMMMMMMALFMVQSLLLFGEKGRSVYCTVSLAVHQQPRHGDVFIGHHFVRPTDD